MICSIQMLGEVTLRYVCDFLAVEMKECMIWRTVQNIISFQFSFQHTVLWSYKSLNLSFKNDHFPWRNQFFLNPPLFMVTSYGRPPITSKSSYKKIPNYETNWLHNFSDPASRHLAYLPTTCWDLPSFVSHDYDWWRISRATKPTNQTLVSNINLF